jgi:hypothetical protein
MPLFQCWFTLPDASPSLLDSQRECTLQLGSVHLSVVEGAGVHCQLVVAGLPTREQIVAVLTSPFVS